MVYCDGLVYQPPVYQASSTEIEGWLNDLADQLVAASSVSSSLWVLFEEGMSWRIDCLVHSPTIWISTTCVPYRHYAVSG